MLKKIIVVIVGVFMFFLFALYLYAQNYSSNDKILTDILINVQNVEEKIDKLQASSPKEDNRNQEIINKLNQLLSNQDQIIKELEIVKVRASVKR